MFTIYEGLHPRSDVDRLYILRNDGGRGLIAIKDCVELAVRCLKVHVHRSKERLLQDGMRDKVDDLEAATGLPLDLKNQEKYLKRTPWKPGKNFEYLDF